MTRFLTLLPVGFEYMYPYFSSMKSHESQVIYGILSAVITDVRTNLKRLLGTKKVLQIIARKMYYNRVS